MTTAKFATTEYSMKTHKENITEFEKIYDKLKQKTNKAYRKRKMYCLFYGKPTITSHKVH